MSEKHDRFYTTLEKEALICGRCGYCRSSCPVYNVIGWESAAPRGKMSLAREAFAHGRTGKLSDEFVQRVSQCTLCGACASACSTAIDTRRFWMDLRHKIVEKGREPKAYDAIRDGLLERKNISTFSNEDRLEWAQDLDEEPEGLDRKAGAEVCYYMGCVPAFFPAASQIPLALTEILMRSEVDFTTMGSEEWCCGFPLLASGFVEEAREFGRHNVQTLKDLDIHTLITGCASCYHVWKHEYTEEIGDYPLEIMHSTEYLARLIEEGRLELNELDEVITYHDPCDLGRNSGVYEAPRKIITSIPGVRFVELEHNRADSTCCGGGGNLQSVDPDLAAEIARRRAQEIKESGATIIVSACQQCEQMLITALQKSGIPVRVMDITQLVLEAMD